MRSDPSPEDAAPGVTSDASETAPKLADLKTTGESCHTDRDHGCVIDNLGEVYWAMERSQQVDELGLKYVRWLSESCDQWLEEARDTQQAELSQYEARLRECKSILVNQISEIEIQRPPKGKHHKKQRQAIRREVKWSNERLPILARKITGELDQVDDSPQAPTPSTMADFIPPRPDVGPTTAGPISLDAPLPKPRSSGLDRDQVLRNTRLRYAMDIIVVAGGGLAVLSGASLMVNGAAWTSCSRKYRDADGTASTRCAQLLGLAEATDLGSVFAGEKYTQKDFDVASDDARKSSTRNWVLGALVIGAAGAVITVGALDLEKVLDIRKKYSLAASWSPASPHSGALSFTARF